MINNKVTILEAEKAAHYLAEAEISPISTPIIIERLLTPEEMNYVITVWHVMSGDHRWFDAFLLICKSDNCAHAIQTAKLAVARYEITTWSKQEHGKIYISGPMTGYPGFNYARFFEIEDLLAGYDIECFNPASRGRQIGWKHADYLRDDIINLSSCDTILVMQGWSESIGALEEVRIGRMLYKMKILYIDNNNMIHRSI